MDSIGVPVLGLLSRLRDRVGGMDINTVMRAAYGVKIGESSCPDCGVILEGGHCLTARWPCCGRPLPRTCPTPACDSLIEPVRSEGAWVPAVALCGACQASSMLEARKAAVYRTFPGPVLALARQWTAYDHRQALDRELHRWREQLPCPAPPSIIVWGCPGSGKTIAVVRQVVQAFLGGVLRSVAYLTEEEAIATVGDLGLEQRREAAAERIRVVTEAHVAILDEFGFTAYSEAQARRIVGIVKRRLDVGAPTIFLTNRIDGLDGWLDSRVSSRLREHAATVACTGVDLRQSASTSWR